MDTTNCPAGWATDVILFYDNVPQSCDMPIGAWVFYFVALCGLKFFIAVGHSYLWIRRENKREKRAGNNSKKGSSRFPVVPTLSWMLFLDYLIFFATATANVGYGVPAFFYGFGWTLFGLATLAYLSKFINLGHRIAYKSSSMERQERDRLSKLDVTGKIIMLITFLAIVGQTVCFCIVGPILPNNYAIIQIANGLDGLFVASAVTSMVYQMQRVKNAICITRDANKEQVSPSSGKELTAVLVKLSSQQVVAGLMSFSSVVFYLLVAVGVLKAQFYIFTIFMLTETFYFSFVMATNCKRKQHAVADNSAGASSGNKAPADKNESVSNSNPTQDQSRSSSMKVFVSNGEASSYVEPMSASGQQQV